MGGIIEDKILDVLGEGKLTVKEIQNSLEQISYERKYGTVNKHLTKMFRLRILDREIIGVAYTYWTRY